MKLIPGVPSLRDRGGPYVGIDDGHVTLPVIFIESWVLDKGWLVWTWNV